MPHICLRSLSGVGKMQKGVNVFAGIRREYDVSREDISAGQREHREGMKQSSKRCCTAYFNKMILAFELSMSGIVMPIGA